MFIVINHSTQPVRPTLHHIHPTEVNKQTPEQRCRITPIEQQSHHMRINNVLPRASHIDVPHNLSSRSLKYFIKNIPPSIHIAMIRHKKHPQPKVTFPHKLLVPSIQPKHLGRPPRITFEQNPMQRAKVRIGVYEPSINIPHVCKTHHIL